jgi:hypothetical protein
VDEPRVFAACSHPAGCEKLVVTAFFNLIFNVNYGTSADVIRENLGCTLGGAAAGAVVYFVYRPASGA